MAEPRTDPQQLVKDVVNYYLTSRDFNGYKVERLPPSELTQLLEPLLRGEILSARYGDMDVNPFIRPFSDPDPATQLQMLKESNLDLVVLYPTKKELLKHVRPGAYAGRPFTLELAQGFGQLDYRCFDLSILEFYRNDPRYYYKAGDVFGAIYAQSGTSAMPESDNVYLQTFGFAYDDQVNRAVLVFLRYLHDLSPEHQQIWNAKLLVGDYTMHPDYYRSSIRGMWSDHVPILDAFGRELHHINEMCGLMGRPPLFDKTFQHSEKPKAFTFLIRPTAQEFYNFVHLLDKALSDNINKDFFGADMPLEEDIHRADGKVEVRQIGTIRLLEQWLAERWIPLDPKPLQEAIATLKHVRKLRQRPAHTVLDDVFDQSFFKQQRELIIKAYSAVRLLRLLFSEHPSVKGRYSKVEDWLLEGRIRDF